MEENNDLDTAEGILRGMQFSCFLWFVIGTVAAIVVVGVSIAF